MDVLYGTLSFPSPSPSLCKAHKTLPKKETIMGYIEKGAFRLEKMYWGCSTESGFGMQAILRFYWNPSARSRYGLMSFIDETKLGSITTTEIDQIIL